MISTAIVDSGPLVAEAAYPIQQRRGSSTEARFLRGLETFDVQAPVAQDWRRISEIVEQYADFPLGGTDASVIALAERLRTEIVITLDRRHFSAVRPQHCERLRLLP